MNRSLLVHGCWLAAATGAFFVGASVSKNRYAAGESRLLTGTRAEAPSLMAGNTEGATNGAGSNEGGSALAMAGGKGKLTEEEIINLGKQLKDRLNPIDRRLAFARLLEALTVDNALLIREQIAHLDHDSSEFREFHYAWGAIGGKDAVMNGRDTDKRDMAATLAGWASANPSAALAWFENQSTDSKEAGFNWGELNGGLIHGLANKDTNLASDYVFKIAETGNRGAEGMLGIVTGKVLQSQGPLAASNWAENLPEGALRASAMDRVAHDLTNKDPEAAAEWVEKFVNEEHSARVIEEVGDEWAERDPVAAVGWIESLDQSKGKTEALSSALGEWVSKDPEAASQYVADLPANAPERNEAISGMVGRLAWEDPVAAISWAGEINNPKLQEDTLIRAGQAYLRRQPEEARAWLADSGLSERAVEEITKPRRRR
ncbi:MAG: hypothetical protein AAF514_04920 [Verrucomicrobiota bacterium]